MTYTVPSVILLGNSLTVLPVNTLVHMYMHSNGIVQPDNYCPVSDGLKPFAVVMETIVYTSVTIDIGTQPTTPTGTTFVSPW